MSTRLRKWAIRLLATIALPIMLTLGLSAAASAQPTLAPHVTTSTGYASPHSYYRTYGPYFTLGACRSAQGRYHGHYSYCQDHYRYYYHHKYYYVWYLFVRYPR